MWNIKARGGGKKAVWRITDLDYDAPWFTNAEARLGTGLGPALWAKWLHRGIIEPTRTVKGGRGGQYAARTIFQIRVMSVAVEDVAIPPSEAQQIADLAAKGPWKSEELRTERNWRSYVIRDHPLPLDVFLTFSRTGNCWGYEILKGSDFENDASLVLAAARELTAVSKYCWNILNGSGESSDQRGRVI
jgi:hypothetical protein